MLLYTTLYFSEMLSSMGRGYRIAQYRMTSQDNVMGNLPGKDSVAIDSTWCNKSLPHLLSIKGVTFEKVISMNDLIDH